MLENCSFINGKYLKRESRKGKGKLGVGQKMRRIVAEGEWQKESGRRRVGEREWEKESGRRRVGEGEWEK